MQQNNEVVLNTDKYIKNSAKMQKNNNAMIGYDNIQDFLNSLLGLKNSVFNTLVALFAMTTHFITNYVWSDAKSIYFMIFLIAFDAATGITRAVKNGTFTSSRLPRIFVIMITYCSLLALSWNVAKISPFYSFLPSTLYGGFIATLTVSVFENLHELKLIPENLYKVVKGKLDLLQAFIFGKNFNKKNKK